MPSTVQSFKEAKINMTRACPAGAYGWKGEGVTQASTCSECGEVTR
jgi:ferredoxin-like protein FixX